MGARVGEFAQFVIAGLKSGAIYSLVALGFTLVYAATGAINFAQGDFYMLGGMLGVWLYSLGLPLPMAVVGSISLTTAAGAAFECLAVRPIASGDPLRIIMVTIGGSVVIRQAMMHLFGPDEMPLPVFSAGRPIRVLGAAIELQTLWVWGAAAACLLALVVLYRLTPLGKAMRATSIDRDAARLVGIDTRAMVTVSFALAAGLGAIAGLVVSPMTQTAFDVGAGMGVKGFAAAILGGLGNPVAAVGGGLLLGLMESMTAGYIDPLYKDAMALAVLLGVLFLRPQGLFGAARREKV